MRKVIIVFAALSALWFGGGHVTSDAATGHHQMASQRIDPPQNWQPCRSSRSVHCTFGQPREGIDSYWHGASQRDHMVTRQRADTRMTQGFRYYGWDPVGRQRHHRGCWINRDSTIVRCKDGGFWRT